MSLEALVRGVREAGVDVDVTIEGTKRDVPAMVDLAAYRVVQEALTNAVKHAPHQRVAVRITYTQTTLHVDVSAAGTTESAKVKSEASGFGLLGLRERARAVGGRLDAGPTADGGFRVSAGLPTGDPA